MVLAQTLSLFRRELLTEQRRRYAFFGVLLYVVATVFVSRYSFRVVREVPVWNALFWIILLFASVIAVARSFAQESSGRLLYLYTLADPRAVLFAKLLYNSLLMIVLGLTGLAVFGIVVNYPVADTPLFLLTLVLGCMGLAGTFTLISAIASKAGNNFALMSVLGFPVVLPMLLAIIRASKMAADGTGWDGAAMYLGIIIALNVIVVTLSGLLFPYLWRD
ncbi:MAG: heme exporter protein CcmB [Bacteroidia bacterium]|jgi:heme exporter protein B|nr:heme exporter protein CcmB [Bacteroidia bacterium]